MLEELLANSSYIIRIGLEKMMDSACSINMVTSPQNDYVGDPASAQTRAENAGQILSSGMWTFNASHLNQVPASIVRYDTDLIVYGQQSLTRSREWAPRELSGDGVGRNGGYKSRE